MSEHALLSPSASYRWMQCPGSVALCAQASDTGSSPAAERGTRLHAICAAALRGDTVDIPPEVRRYVEYGHAAMRRRRAHVWIEQTMRVTDQLFGTPDLVVLSGRTLEVIDLKTGYQRVDAAGNTQLVIYADAALRTYPALTKNVRQIVCTIVQDEVRTAVLSRTAHRAAMRRILADADRALSASAPLMTGPHCQHCPAASICHARKTETVAHARRAFREVVQPDDQTLIAAIQDGKRVIEYIERLLAAAIASPPHGYRLTEGARRRVWKADAVVPMIPKPMTIAEAEAASINIADMTELRYGTPKLIKTAEAIDAHFGDLTDD